jgi:crotonobetainyl-CoA:carnitine CoA-transferase CaiB-like acyl-CoA transferase
MLALENVRVVDLTEALAGPYCTMLLADLGADVLKIERPGVGDQSRRWGARLPGGESAYFCSTNRNKRSLALNITTPASQAAMHRLLATADVFVCNIPRADSLRRAALDPENLRARFPRLAAPAPTPAGRATTWWRRVKPG